MLVIIDGKVYNPEETPIMVVLNDQDKENIKNMHPEANKYLAYPDNTLLGTAQVIMDKMVETLDADIKEKKK